MNALLRQWHLLSFPPFIYGWLAVFQVNAARQWPIVGDDLPEILIGAGLLALISIAIWAARRLRQAEQTGWRWTGYGLTAIAIPAWVVGFAISCFFASLQGHSLHIGC